jgi:damage-control phosphatase, subfamily I
VSTYLDCVPCFLRQSLEAARNITEDTRIHEQIVRDVLRMAANLDLNLPPPFLGQMIHRRLRDLTGVKDPYHAVKSYFNRLVVAALPELRAAVRQAPDPLLAATQCAVAANTIDMAVVATLTEAEVLSTLRRSMDEPLHGPWERFRGLIAGASHILYLADNAGEIAVDRLVIEELGPGRVTLAVRGSPVLNDATKADAIEVGMEDFVEIIDNGSDAPGTILADCSESFGQRFERAELIISKGLGNFETLRPVDANIAFLFKVKCPVVSRHVGLPIGAHVLRVPDEQPTPSRAARKSANERGPL